MVSIKDLQKSEKGKGVDYEFLRLQDAIGNIADAISKLKDKKISKAVFKKEIRKSLTHSLLDIIRIANSADVDIEKQFSVWSRFREGKERVKIGLVKGYTKLAPDYDIIPNAATESEEKDFYKIIGNVKEKRILDVGCGTGRYTIPLAKIGGKMEGIDISPGMLREARKKAKKAKVKIIFKKGDMLNLPYKKNSFDTIISNLAIDHIEDLNKAIKEMVRVCKKSGYIIISSIHPDVGGAKGGWGEAPFDIDKKIIVIERYRRPVMDFVETLNRNGALIKKIKNIKISKAFKKKKPELYESLQGKNLILMIKAQKVK